MGIACHSAPVKIAYYGSAAVLLSACIPVLDPLLAQMKLALRGLVTYELKQEPGRVAVRVWVNVSWLRRWEREWAGNPPFSTLPTSESFSP